MVTMPLEEYKMDELNKINQLEKSQIPLLGNHSVFLEEENIKLKQKYEKLENEYKMLYDICITLNKEVEEAIKLRNTCEILVKKINKYMKADDEDCIKLSNILNKLEKNIK
jgi:hypothetical protein